jgi:F-type H+-transporting ATPase subunit gamma
MEVHKLARFLESQRKVSKSIEAATADLLQFHGALLDSGRTFRELYLLVGSERGFCGDFNESIMRAVESVDAAAHEKRFIVVGTKLAARLSSDARLHAAIEGPSVVEEVDGVLLKLMRTLGEEPASGALEMPLRLKVLHHQPEEDDVTVTVLQPLQPSSRPGVSYAYAPLLYLEAHALLTGLAEQYLFAALHELLYMSLMAENQRRMKHMDAAVRRLEQTSTELLRRRNLLRQEEITEEIEVIMLSVEALE